MSRKLVLITDSGSAIGEAIARHLASQGYKVMLGGRSLDRLAALAGAITRAGSASYQELDVTSRGSLRAFLLIAEACHGPIDALVDTAGMPPAMAAVLATQGIARVLHVPTDHALQANAIAGTIGRALEQPGTIDPGLRRFRPAMRA
ncbi:SDR family NAD(P)-dependent oxidoreductase [Tardiphaga sp. vice352]|uniref:SDR family oxidoreductase n=1 Tax=unclassified Tardiphaga TaxID=2631404 RepID=UPI0011620458|nr:SDR family NAD(P)-dependent oxidoreductase [Tardiphaga sp. vice278]QDM22065.1 SDR family NAD(P)-dependent oxidoreductase [Tardiphaga sp. vice154]QDM27318.1 SDR family NAD(P)-dependent oxidoreductase [Tardiphaga sp. vice304]QDM32443.1 SDR family NAD(P)-dependent oxidoreductase [Tardiphaga sp. vice352]